MGAKRKPGQRGPDRPDGPLRPPRLERMKAEVELYWRIVEELGRDSSPRSVHDFFRARGLTPRNIRMRGRRAAMLRQESVPRFILSAPEA